VLAFVTPTAGCADIAVALAPFLVIQCRGVAIAPPDPNIDKRVPPDTPDKGMCATASADSKPQHTAAVFNLC
jgi:hypothetical protein